MNALELYQAGRLDEAITELGGSLRSDPLNAQRRTFLFELLCFAGEYDRAEKHLDVLAASGKEADMGALLYRSALHAERNRQEIFAVDGTPPGKLVSSPVSGTLNGQRFESIADADPRIGARFELFAAGQYTLIPFAQLESVRIAAPARLRDLLWGTAIVRAAAGVTGFDLGEVLVPTLTPDAWRSSDPLVRLGRVTDWISLEGGAEVPVGQRLLLVDGEEVPILEVRELVIDSSVPAGA
ncbi:MAG: virulence protein SciE type [Gemmatimonadota bacterium]|jgi:type VI secretion system protein ImpE|nr:virulence protein SciE type [Gemmatimonadota bacterium]